MSFGENTMESNKANISPNHGKVNSKTTQLRNDICANRSGQTEFEEQIDNTLHKQLKDVIQLFNSRPSTKAVGYLVPTTWKNTEPMQSSISRSTALHLNIARDGSIPT
jgi:hypothetical protein